MNDPLREAARLAIDFLALVEHTQGITLECRKGLSAALAAPVPEPKPPPYTIIDDGRGRRGISSPMLAPCATRKPA